MSNEASIDRCLRQADSRNRQRYKMALNC